MIERSQARAMHAHETLERAVAALRGSTSWLTVGRAVRNGQRSITIFASRPWERRSCGA